MFPKSTAFTVYLVAFVLTSCKCGPTLPSRSIVENVAANEAVKLVISNPNEKDLAVQFFKNYDRSWQANSSLGMQLFGTMGLVSGALKVEETLSKNLQSIVNELIDGFNKSSPSENMRKLLVIQETIERDRASVAVLNSLLEFTRRPNDFDALQKDMRRILKQVKKYYLLK